MKKLTALERFKISVEEGKMYANFDETKECFIYIGGRHYEETAQIHLSKPEAIALRDWLNKALPKRKAASESEETEMTLHKMKHTTQTHNTRLCETCAS